MKLISLVFILTLISIFSYGQKGYETKFSQPNPAEYQVSFTVTDWKLENVQLEGVDFQQIKFNSSVTTLEKGWAELPCISASIQLPAQKNVDLNIVFTAYKDYPLEFPLVPSRGPIKRNQDPNTIPYQIAPASMLDEFYPATFAFAEEPFVIRDVRGTTVRVFPFQYNAVTNTLRVYSRIDVLLTENKEPVTNPLLKENANPLREMRGMYRSMFLNYAEPKIPLTMAEYGDILVITTARDEEAIQPYIDWKKEKGYKVTKEIVSVGTTGITIKSLINNFYNANNNLMYVLLVGAWEDIKSETFVAECDGSENWMDCPTDPMLGDVVGNANDFRPEISVGRMSANSAEQVTVQVNKVIQYEKKPNMGVWYSTFIGMASNEKGTTADDGEYDYEHVQRIYTQRLNPALEYKTHRRLYENESGCTVANLMSYINNTGASTLAYCGHGTSKKFTTTGFNNENVSQLINGDRLPFIVSTACAQGGFQKTGCFAEHWLRNENGGAILTLMSSMDQWWAPPMRGQDYFYDILSGGFNYNNYPGQDGINTEEQRTHWGAIVVNAHNLMLIESSTVYDQETVRTWTTFGDPSLQLRTKQPAVLASSMPVVMVGLPYTATITANGTPVKDALVCISQDGVYLSAFTDENGKVSIAHEFALGEVLLVVTAFNTSTIYENIECVPQPQYCNIPEEFSVTLEEKTPIVRWSEPKTIDGVLLGYEVFRNAEKITETTLPPSILEYRDNDELATGVYEYQVSAKYLHCISDLTTGVSINIIGINEIEAELFQIFPNPAHNEITIKGEGITKIEMYDIAGKQLSSPLLITTSSLHNINVSHLNSGVYFVKIFAGNNQTVKRLAIVR